MRSIAPAGSATDQFTPHACELVKMQSYDLLSSLTKRGVKIWTENGQLRFHAPKGALLTEELDTLRSMKAEIVELLKGADFSAVTPLEPRLASDRLPLAGSQMRWWRYSKDAERAAFVGVRMCYVAMRALGPLNIEILRASIEFVVNRHKSLRTRIVEVDGIPWQQIDSSSKCTLEIVDLAHTSPIYKEAEVRRLGSEFVRAKVDLSIGPLFSAKLFSISDRDHVLVLALEHMITDGVSNAILRQEIWTLYDQALRGLPFSLPKLPLQFADYALWQQQNLGAWLKEHEAYWIRHLTGAPRIGLPFEKLQHRTNCSGTKHPVYVTLETQFGNELTADLRDLARRAQTLLPVVFLTVHLIAMARWCEQRDLTLMFISHARFQPELENVVGFFASPIYLRIKLNEEDNFFSLLKRADLELQSACEHFDFDRVPNLVPECSTALSFNWGSADWVHAPVELQSAADDAIKVQPFSLGVSWPINFTIAFYENANGVNVAITYREDLFAPCTLQRFCDDLKSLAVEISRRPFAHLSLTSAQGLAGQAPNNSSHS